MAINKIKKLNNNIKLSTELSHKISLTRIILICFAVYLVSRLMIAFEYSSINLMLHNTKSLVDNLYRWDAPIYAAIAKNGYPITTVPDADLWPWFPLWPIILRIFSLNLLIPLNYTALVLSQILFFCSMVFLWLYLDKLKFNFENILFTTLTLAISPANIYYCAGLSEPLFLFLSLATLYFLMSNKFKTMLVFAFLLSGTRMTGEFILLPIFYHLYKTNNLSIKKCLIYIPVISGGLICYMIYLKIVSDDFIMFIHAEATRNRNIMGIGQIFDNTATIFSTAQIYDSSIFVITLFIITFILLKAKLIKEAILNTLSIIPGYLSGTLWNSFRFDTAIFTFYIGLAVLGAQFKMAKYVIISLLSVMSYICWFYWLSGSWYFA